MIQIESVSHRLFTSAGCVNALEDVSLTIERGEAVALMGANGSGKSTLCRCLNGLVVPDTGAVRVDGLRTGDPVCAGEIRRRVGMVFQDPSQQLVSWSVEEEIAFGPENLQLPPREIDSAVEGNLRRWSLEGLRKRHPLRLSGGQMARVSLAAVLAMEPRYLVVDEPTSLLDSRGRATLLRAINEIQARADVGVLWVTQYPDEVARFERLIVMSGGRVVADDRPGAILCDVDRLASWGLEAPPAALLAASLRRRGVRLSAGTFSIEPLLAELESIGLRPASAGSAGETSGVVGLGDTARGASEGHEAVWTTSGRAGGTPKRYDSRAGVGEQVGFDGDGGRARVNGRVSGAVRGPLLSMTDVRCGYPGGVQVLGGVSAELGPGEGLGLVGPSGAGKTTFILAASGALRPSAGAIRRCADGQRGPVALAAQLPEEGFCANTVAEEVALALHGWGMDAAQQRRRVEQSLETVGLDYARVALRSPHSLSDGEKKKVALASALAPESELLMLDEPTQGLDGPSAGKALGAVRRHLDRGGAAIIASHAGDFLLCATDFLLALRNGLAVEHGSWVELLFGENKSPLVPDGQLVTAVVWAGFRPSVGFAETVTAAVERVSDFIVRAHESVSDRGVIAGS